MKKLISAMLCLAILVGVLAFAGCKQKNNDETTVPPDTDAAIDNIVGDDTEPALEDTTQSAQPGQPVQPAKPAQQVQPTKPASTKPVATTQKPEQAVKPAPTPNTTTPQVEKPSAWKKAGTYTCDKDITAGIYYIKSNGNNCRVILTKGDKKVEFYPLSYGLFVEMRKGYVLKIENGEFISERELKPMTSSNGVYKLGTYRIGEDIPAGEYVIGEFGNTDFSILNSVDFLSGNNYAITYRGLRVYVKLEAGDYIIFNKDTKVVKAKDRTGSYDEKDKSYGGGTYLVGANQDMKAGKYVLVPTDDGNGYSTGAAHIKFSQITGELNVKKDKSIIIELKDGEFISFEGFKLVEYVEPAPTEPSSEPSSTPSGESSSESKSDADTPKNNEAGDNNKPNNNAGDDKANENKS